MTEVLRRPLVEVTALLGRREISPVELMQATLDRIDAVNPDLNAFVAMRERDALLADARAAEARILRGEARALEGVPLGQLILEQEQLPVPLALWIARQVADGLDALFTTTGMIHCDVKSANILVSAAGHATLIDFGFVQTPAEASQWATRPLAGTLAYIAPEMVTSALAAGPRSDIYSLGVTLYEMISGRRPWESDDPGELAMLHRQAKPTDVRALRPEVPAPVAELIQSMLAKDPLRRPASARELATRLVRLEIDSFTLR